LDSLEYYDSKNIYYNLGYWPDEIYRLGVVYIMKDDSLSPVFNLRGCDFKDLFATNISKSNIPYKKWDPITRKWFSNYIERDTFLSSESDLTNTFGVFKNPIQSEDNVIQNYETKETKP
jgi:Xaa-Pro aminopeptidase